VKVALHLGPVNNGPFNCRSARKVELAEEHVLCNDVHLPWEHHMRGGPKLYVIGHEFGPLVAVWADHEQDAWGEAVNANMLDCLMVSVEDQAKASEEEQEEEWARLGNASEPFDLTNAWIQPVAFCEDRDVRLLCRFAEARGSGAKTLDD